MYVKEYSFQRYIVYDNVLRLLIMSALKRGTSAWKQKFDFGAALCGHLMNSQTLVMKAESNKAQSASSDVPQ